MKPFAYFLCALAILLMAISPWLILSYYEKLPEEPYFEGILHMWHITGWRTGGSSAAAFLEGRIRKYEAQNPHVFIELICLTPEKAAEALKNGQVPDIVSYPYGQKPELAFAPLQDHDFILPCGSKDAWPYMFGGYCIILNNDLVSENSVDVDQGWGIRPDTLLEAAQYGVAFDSEPGYSVLPALALHAYPETEEMNMSPWDTPESPDAALGLSNVVYTDGLNAFCKGESAVLIASHRQLFEVTECYTQGEAPPFAAFAVGGYTDMAQMLSITVHESDLKQTECENFISYLVSPSSQKRLEASGVLPSVEGVDIYQQNDVLKAMYDQLCTSGSFASSEDRQTLDALAMEAYSGSASALAKLRAMLK